MSDSPAYSMPTAALVRLDPRTKLILMFMIAILLTFKHEDILFVGVTGAICCVLLFTNLQFKTALIYGGLFLLAIPAKASQGQNLLPPAVETICILYSALVLRLFPTFMFGYYLIKSTSVSEFSAAMRQWHISSKLVIPVLVVFRFIPTIAEEYRSIKLAMRMREINFGSRRFRQEPGILLEYRMIPLMMSVVRIGEELSAAALSKGLDSEKERTNVAEIGIRLPDVVLLTAFVLFAFGDMLRKTLV